MGKLLRGISKNGGVVFTALDSTDIARQMREYHDTSAVTSAALGRLLTAAGLMGAMLKQKQNSVTLRVDGGGPAGILLAVADGAGHVKGYVQEPFAEMPPRADGKLDVGGAVGRAGMLSVVKDLGMKEPYTGLTPLVSGEIAEDITQYYAVSEQIPTVCALGVLVDRDLSIVCAGGYLIQLLPGATDGEISLLEENVAQMPSVTAMLSQGTPLEAMMEKALCGFEPEVLECSQVQYACDCRRARVERALISLGKEELRRLAAEEPMAKVSCQFCNREYCVDVPALLRGLGI